VSILVLGSSTLASCGDDPPSPREEIEAVYEQFLTAEIEGDVDAYCDSVVFFSTDLGGYKPAEYDERLDESSGFCESDFEKEFARRGDLSAAVEIVDADITVDGSKAKGRFTLQVDGERQTTAPEFVKPAGHGWYVALTGY
jgi:hypothetical protein